MTDASRPFVGIHAVTFDADETLWQFEIAMRRALARVIELVAELHPAAAQRWTVDDLIARRDALADTHPRPATTIEEIRRLSFTEALLDDGIDDPELAARVTERYFHHRHGDVELFDDALPMFDALPARLRVGLVTNGNTDPERSALAGRFAFAIHADRVGSMKPEPRIFELTIEAAGCPAAAVVHVGDSLANDVAPASAIGIRTVWLNRDHRPLPARAVVPDATISTLHELPALLG